MSEFEEGWPPAWFPDISSAFALSKQTTPERRLQAFLATLSAETLRLAASETAEAAGEGFAYATACPNALFNDPGAQGCDEGLDPLKPRVYFILIPQSVQRGGAV